MVRNWYGIITEIVRGFSGRPALSSGRHSRQAGTLSRFENAGLLGLGMVLSPPAQGGRGQANPNTKNLTSGLSRLADSLGLVETADYTKDHRLNSPPPLRKPTSPPPKPAKPKKLYTGKKKGGPEGAKKWRQRRAAYAALLFLFPFFVQFFCTPPPPHNRTFFFSFRGWGKAPKGPRGCTYGGSRRRLYIKAGRKKKTICGGGRGTKKP